MKKNYVLFAFIFLGYISGKAQDNWIPTFENTELVIQYQLKDCVDSDNGFDFEYYVLKLENKTDQAIILQYVLGDTTNFSEEENAANLILKPKQTLVGGCMTGDNLKMFSRDNKSKNPESNSFKISKIKTYAL